MTILQEVTINESVLLVFLRQYTVLKKLKNSFLSQFSWQSQQDEVLERS